MISFQFSFILVIPLPGLEPFLFIVDEIYAKTFVYLRFVTLHEHSPPQRLFGVFSKLFSWLTGRFKFIKEDSRRAMGLQGVSWDTWRE